MSLVSLTFQVPATRLAALLAAGPTIEAEPQLPIGARAQHVPALSPTLDPSALPRWALDSRGNRVDFGASEHVITQLPTVGLMFDVRKPQPASSLAKAREVAAQCDLLGRKGDWVVGEDYETQLIIDRNFHEPAVDKRAFPNMPDSGLIYTNRKAAWSPDRVWFVDLSHGLVDWYYDDNGGLVVPVLRVPVSQ